MRNLFLIIALLASTAALSQTTLVVNLVVNDLQYSEGVETEWDVLYIPNDPINDIRSLEEGDGWSLNIRDDHRFFVLRPNEPGVYQVKQELDDVIIQISSFSVE